MKSLDFSKFKLDKSILEESIEKRNDGEWNEKSEGGGEKERNKWGRGRDIAIIGIGAKLPLGDTLEDFWENLRLGKDCIRSLPEVRKEQVDKILRVVLGMEGIPGYAQFGYLDRIDCFDYDYFNISPKEARITDPYQRLFLQTAWSALEEGGYGGGRLRGSHTGVYVGVEARQNSYQSLVMRVEKDMGEELIPGNLDPIIASRIAYILDFHGPNMIVNTTCSSSALSVHLACKGILDGECDQAIAGGIFLNLIPLDDSANSAIMSSSGRARTFDDGADGTSGGEGVIAFLLKGLKEAIRDRDHIHCIIKGSAVNADGKSLGITAPNGVAQGDVIEQAWKNANINPESLSLIEAHGTATPIGDPIEIEGLTRAFRRYTSKKGFCAIGSVKASIGHLGGAAGAAGILKCILALKNKEIPPLVHFNRPNRKINFEESPFYINAWLTQWERGITARRCGVSSFGMSGTNVHIVLEEAPEMKIDERNGWEKEGEKEKDLDLLTLSTGSEEQLMILLGKYRVHLEGYTETELDRVFHDICYTANTGRDRHHRARLGIVVENGRDLKRKIGIVIEKGLLDETLCQEMIFYKNVQASLKELGNLKEIDGVSVLELAKGYAEGLIVDISAYYRDKKLYKVSLPTYPFKETSCWVKIPESMEPVVGGTVGSSGNKAAGEAVKQEFPPVELTGRPNGVYSSEEQLVASIWGEVLGFEKVNVSANFFELGGDSLTSLKLQNNLARLTGLQLADGFFLSYITIETQGGYISKKRGRAEFKPALNLAPEHRSLIWRMDSWLGEHLAPSYIAGKTYGRIYPLYKGMKGVFSSIDLPVLSWGGEENLLSLVQFPGDSFIVLEGSRRDGLFETEYTIERVGDTVQAEMKGTSWRIWASFDKNLGLIGMQKEYYGNCPIGRLGVESSGNTYLLEKKKLDGGVIKKQVPMWGIVSYEMLIWVLQGAYKKGLKEFWCLLMVDERIFRVEVVLNETVSINKIFAKEKHSFSRFIREIPEGIEGVSYRIKGVDDHYFYKGEVVLRKDNGAFVGMRHNFFRSKYFFLVKQRSNEEKSIRREENIFPVSTPESEGMDVRRLEELVRRLENFHYGRQYSLIVLKNDKLVMERYFNGFNEDDIRPLYSINKSIMALLVGIAVGQGKIKSVDEPVINYFPGEKFAGMNKWKKKITLRNLVSMQSGMAYDEGRRWIVLGSKSPQKYVMDFKMLREPGGIFDYNCKSIILVAKILQLATGMYADEFARKYLFDPLGIKDVSHRFCFEGTPYSNGGIALRPMDMLKIGKLVLDGGKWEGQQIVPEEWVRLLGSWHGGKKVSADKLKDYGYLWWLMGYDQPGTDREFVPVAWGMGGQYIFVIRPENLVVVVTGENLVKSLLHHAQTAPEFVKEFILGAGK